MKSTAVWTGLAALLILLFVFSPVVAENAPHYDLASLYYMAELVVEVQDGELKKSGHEVMCEVTVLKVHKGKAEVGQKLMVNYSGFPRREWMADKYEKQPDGTVKVILPPPIKFKKALLFLIQREKEEFYCPYGDGVRLVAEDDSVYGFQQFSNPGGYSLAKARPSLLALKNEEAFTEALLFEELKLAAEHVHAYEKAATQASIDTLKTYLRAPWNPAGRPRRYEKDYKLADEAAKRICEIGRPADWFALRLHEQEYDVSWDSKNDLVNKLMAPEAFDFLLTVLEKETVTDAECALAVEELSNTNGLGYEESKEGREARLLQQRPSSESRVLALLHNSPKPAVKIAAAQLLAYWHPHQPLYSKSPIPLTDSWVSALKASIEREPDAAMKTVLIRWYCRMGGLDAYREYFKGDSGIIAYDSERQNHYHPYLKYDIVDMGYWKKGPGHQYVEATALDGPKAGKVFSSSKDQQAPSKRPDPNRWLVHDYSMNVDFKPPLKPGKYALRMVCQLTVEGQEEDWRSEPVEVLVYDPKVPEAGQK